MLDSWGIRGAEGVAAGTAVIGLLFTLAFLPEPKGKSLEELEAAAYESRRPRSPWSRRRHSGPPWA